MAARRAFREGVDMTRGAVRSRCLYRRDRLWRERMDLIPGTTCWSRISAIIAGRSSYINHKKPAHGKPRPPNTNRIYCYKNGILFSASFISPATLFFFSLPSPPDFINHFNSIRKKEAAERLNGKNMTNLQASRGYKHHC